jgi:hypothetical protein
MRTLFAALLALLVSLPAQAEERFAEAELDQMLAPVALYPDALLSQVLMAATYPLDVVEAARWTRAHPGLQGDEAVTRVADEPWDPSVKSLVAFPHLIQRMDEQLDWTRRLGAAFLGQEPEVTVAVQRLRQRAQAAGHLLPDERLRVVTGGEVIVIEPADARVVYVPYYDPWVVYGAWGWPAHPPVVWAAWPGYSVARPGFWWGVGIGVTAGFFFGDFDWHHHHVKVVHVQNHYLRPHARNYRPIQVGKWRHAPAPRRTLGRQQVRQRPVVHRPVAHRRVEATRPAPVRLAPQTRPMPPAFGVAPPVQRAGSQPPARAPRAVPYDGRHGSAGRTVDRADRVGRVRADVAQHRPAQSHGSARDARRDAGAVPVRPAVRFGVAGDRPRMAR